MEQKTCKHCGLVDDANKFPSAGWTNGKQYRRNVCMTCYWKKVKQPRRESNLDWYFKLKKDLKCVDCGNSDFRVLDFHHLDPDQKSFNVANAAQSGLGKERLLEEIAKCHCLCSNCHRIRTWDAQH